ncbi:MAG: 2-C-methyl-D-erythritol 4-phosphate cytidylyltransferase [Acidimicrobiales bacterium]|jgi:2-C-methyl-D-erythritol 4-phosphate cytidylyltransferase|nr:2-C-methyl-D-erythritol 4-phosphate cytidylyltransferase [Acidimicrobiales bacterium]
MKTWTILVAAGEGFRFGSRKQLAELAGMPVLLHSTISASSVSDGIVVVTVEEDIEIVESCLKSVNQVHQVVKGGATRSESVRCGLERVPHDCEIVIVHDGARPLASQELFESVVRKIKDGAEAAVPVVSIADSLRSVNGKQINRDEVVAVQTPQAFKASLLREAYSSGEDATDDSALVESVGGTIDFVDGDINNLKITVSTDLLIAEQFLMSKKSN